jgi:putative membrane protein
MMTVASFASSGWHEGRGWDGPPWPAFLLLFVLLAAAVVVGLLVLRTRRPLAAVDIVAERYARGEIDEDEYRRRLAELRSKGSPPTSRTA